RGAPLPRTDRLPQTGCQSSAFGRNGGRFCDLRPPGTRSQRRPPNTRQPSGLSELQVPPEAKCAAKQEISGGVRSPYEKGPFGGPFSAGGGEGGIDGAHPCAPPLRGALRASKSAIVPICRTNGSIHTTLSATYQKGPLVGPFR